MADAGDDRARRALHRAGQGQGLEPVEQLGEHDPRLEAGQRRPQAEVGPEAEAHVRVGVAVDAQPVGVGAEHLLVPVGRGVDQQHRVALGDRHAPDGGGRGGRAHERDDRRRPAQQLLDGAREERPVGPQRRPLVRGARPGPPGPPEIRLRVVSLPATSSWIRNMASSASLSSSPPPAGSCPTVASTETRSSAGARPPLLGHADQVLPHLELQLRPLLLGPFATRRGSPPRTTRRSAATARRRPPAARR